MNKLESLFESYLSESQENRIRVLSNASFAIFKYLKDTVKFEEQKCFNFLLFMYGVAIYNDGELTPEQYELITGSVGLKASYEELKAYLEKLVDPGDEEHLLGATKSYNDTTVQSSILIAVVILMSTKGQYSTKDKELIAKLEDCHGASTNAKTNEDMGVSSKIFNLQDEIMAMDRDDRKDLVLSTAERIKENKDKDIISALRFFSILFVNNDYGKEKMNEYMVMSLYLDIEYADIEIANEKQLDEKELMKNLEIVKRSGLKDDFITLGISLAAIDGIVSEGALKLADIIDKYC